MRAGEILPLSDTEYSLPANADSLYLHDMAVSGASTYWLRHGFEAVVADDAVYMVRSI